MFVAKRLDELAERRHRILRRIRNNVFPERKDLFNYFRDKKFRQLFQLTKETAAFLVHKLELDKCFDKATDISPELQVRILLEYLASGSFQIYV